MKQQWYPFSGYHTSENRYHHSGTHFRGYGDHFLWYGTSMAWYRGIAPILWTPVDIVQSQSSNSWLSLKELSATYVGCWLLPAKMEWKKMFIFDRCAIQQHSFIIWATEVMYLQAILFIVHIFHTTQFIALWRLNISQNLLKNPSMAGY